MLVYANIFQPLIDVFEAVLKFFHNSIGVSWGFSIVLLTISMRAVLLPLTLKQFHSMQKMQVLAPQMKEVQKKYKEDKQRQQQEIMKLYQEHKINPLSSCLPLVAQIPVFISLFYMLRQSLRLDICPAIQRAYQHIGPTAVISKAHTVPCGPHGHAGFLFIGDLTNKATGATLIVLIILYVGTQLLSTQLMQTPGMDATMKRVTQLMPLFFVIFIISFPAGVIVYWITTNAWTMAQQLVIRRLLPPPVLATAGEGPSGGSAGRGGGGSGGPGGGDDGRNGAGFGGGLGALLRGRTKEPEEPAGVGAKRTTRTAAPPPPPRKKKKRSGRRR
jgi:YidC/Oxa1 family membrane protein insertase